MADFSAPGGFESSLYLERWVAIVRDRVVGVGLTRSQAQLAAKRIRPKDRPQLFYVDAAGNVCKSETEMINPNPQEWFFHQPLLKEVVQILKARQIEGYLVGGAVRDFLLNRPNVVDLDFAVPDDGLNPARIVANALGGSFYPLDAERSTGRAVCDQPGSTQKIFLDFAAYRGADLTADLLDRDFTINAIALSLTDSPQLIDPACGQHDLAAGLIKMVSPGAFQHDPVRVVRAVRQAIDFGFAIEPDTAQAIRQAAPLLPRVSPERQREELLKLLNTPAPGQAVRQLHQLGVLVHLLPETAAMAGVPQSPPHHLPVLEHTALALDRWAGMAAAGWPDIPPGYRPRLDDYFGTELAGNLSLKKLMPLALLLHDTGKPLTGTETETGRLYFIGHEKESAQIAYNIGRRFRFSSQAADFVELVVSQHMRPIWLAGQQAMSRRASYRFFRDTTGKGFQAGVAVALHAVADHDATFAPGAGAAERRSLLAVVHRLLADFFDRREQLVDPPLLLSGRDLMQQLGLKQGKLIGQLLLRLKEAQAVGDVSTPAEALDFISADPDLVRHRAGNL